MFVQVDRVSKYSIYGTIRSSNVQLKTSSSFTFINNLCLLDFDGSNNYYRQYLYYYFEICDLTIYVSFFSYNAVDEIFELLFSIKKNLLNYLLASFFFYIFIIIFSYFSSLSFCCSTCIIHK